MSYFIQYLPGEGVLKVREYLHEKVGIWWFKIVSDTIKDCKYNVEAVTQVQTYKDLIEAVSHLGSVIINKLITSIFAGLKIIIWKIFVKKRLSYFVWLCRLKLNNGFLSFSWNVRTVDRHYNGGKHLEAWSLISKKFQRLR